MKLPGIKRIFPLILTILLIPGMLVVPARADESDSYWINLLDYGYPSGYSTNYIPLDGNQANILYTNPVGGPLDYVDIILRTDSTSFRVATWNAFLTTVDLGGGLFRVFGNLAKGYSYADAEVFFRDYNGSYVEILSFKVSRYTSYRYEKICVGKVFDYSTSPATQSTVNYQGDGEPSNQIQFHSASYDQLTWLADLDIYQWQTMDYIQLSATSFCGSIDSISVTCNGVNVPFSYVPTTGDEKGGLTLAFIDLLIDVRNLDRIDSASTIVVKIVGSQSANKTGNFIVQSCHGIVAVDAPSTETFWFTKLIDSISSGFASVSTWISEQTSSLVSWLSQINTSLAIGFDGVSTWLRYIYDSVGSGFTSVGTWFTDQTTALSSTFSIWGDVVRDAVESWGRNLQITVETWGQNIVNAINPPTDTDDMRNEVENIRDQMQDANDVMNELQRPDIDDVFHEVQLDIGTGSPFADIMSGLFANDFIVTIVTGSLAFTLFGILVG